MQYRPLQLAHRVVEASWHHKALEPPPYSLDQIQVRAVRRQPVQHQPSGRPPQLTLSDRSAGVKRGVVQDHHARLALSLRCLRQGVQVERDLPAAARTFDHAVLQPLLAILLQTQRADEVDPSLGPPPAAHPMLVLGTLLRPGVRRGQTQTEAAFVEVLQGDLSFERPFLRSSNSSLAFRSCSGSGGLLGT